MIFWETCNNCDVIGLHLWDICCWQSHGFCSYYWVCCCIHNCRKCWISEVSKNKEVVFPSRFTNTWLLWAPEFKVRGTTTTGETELCLLQPGAGYLHWPARPSLWHWEACISTNGGRGGGSRLKDRHPVSITLENCLNWAKTRLITHV